jgi:hypothetical protein
MCFPWFQKWNKFKYIGFAPEGAGLGVGEISWDHSPSLLIFYWMSNGILIWNNLASPHVTQNLKTMLKLVTKQVGFIIPGIILTVVPLDCFPCLDQK